MRILVTGAAGFVGRHVVRVLRGRGHEVVAASLEGLVVEDAIPLALDVRDHAAVRAAFAEKRPEAVLHLAAIAFVPAVTKDPLLGFETNATGTLVVLSALREAAPDARCVVISTAEVYGRSDLGAKPLPEETPLSPASLYGASKAAAEHLARAFALEGQDVVVLRPFNHIGPGQDKAYVVSSFAFQIAELERSGGGVLRHGNLDAIRDFTDVRDMVRAYALALEAPRGKLTAGVPYNVCSGRGVAIAELVKRLVAMAGVPVRTELDPTRVRKVDVPVFVGDPARFRDAVGFTPEIDFDTTLRDILAAARALV